MPPSEFRVSGWSTSVGRMPNPRSVAEWDLARLRRKGIIRRWIGPTAVHRRCAKSRMQYTLVVKTAVEGA